MDVIAFPGANSSSSDADGVGEYLPRYHSARLNSGDLIEFSSGITVLVGPNNVGKSRLLHNLWAWNGHRGNRQFPVCQELHLTQVNSLDNLIAWCDRNLVDSAATRNNPGQGNYYSGANGRQSNEQGIRHEFNQSGIVNPQIFTIYLAADDRANLTQPTPGYSVVQETPHHALQRLWRRSSYQKLLSEVVLEAFGQDVSVNLESTSQVTLHLGKTTIEHSTERREEYLDEIVRLPLVHDQGHGLRSFVGMMMEIIAGNHRIILLDEPEAFLHPPQARALGSMLRRVRPSGSQIIIATHSVDIIQGLVGGASDDDGLRIIRLSRDNSTQRNFSAQIGSEDVRRFTDDPLLRYSSILEGLFYHGVVLCEADGDATFYSAVNDAHGRPSSADGSTMDLLFAHTNGGYSRFPVAINALRSAKVPIAVIVDIDVVGNESGLALLVSSLGSSIDSLGIASDLASVRNDVNQSASDPLRSDFKRASQGILEKKDRNLSAEEINGLKATLKPVGGWSEVKRIGKGRFRGASLQRVENIIKALAQIGLFVVPVGEMEGFFPRIAPVPKGNWIEEVIREEHYAENGEHVDFVRSIQEYLSAKQKQ